MLPVMSTRAILCAPPCRPPRGTARDRPPDAGPRETVRVPELRPRRVIAPLGPVRAGPRAGGVRVRSLALALLPIFGAAGRRRERVPRPARRGGRREGRHPALRRSARSIYAVGRVASSPTIFLDENRRYRPDRQGRRRWRRTRSSRSRTTRFYEHGALDFPSLIRAAITNLVAGEIEQGGSTITQQLVKNVLIDSPEQTFARKFQEAALAIRRRAQVLRRTRSSSCT